jgi:hypothetical protein
MMEELKETCLESAEKTDEQVSRHRALSVGGELPSAVDKLKHEQESRSALAFKVEISRERLRKADLRIKILEGGLRALQTSMAEQLKSAGKAAASAIRIDLEAALVAVMEREQAPGLDRIGSIYTDAGESFEPQAPRIGTDVSELEKVEEDALEEKFEDDTLKEPIPEHAVSKAILLKLGDFYVNSGSPRFASPKMRDDKANDLPEASTVVDSSGPDVSTMAATVLALQVAAATVKGDAPKG